jgi:repressor LexA
MESLSVRQEKILSFITRYIAVRGYPPSIRNIAKGCGISSSSVARYNLKILEGRNLIRREPNVSRAIVLLKDACPFI